MADQTITVALGELIAVLETRTKMRRAPNGARSIRLREAAILPGRDAVTFEMPGISQAVNVIEGELTDEVVFPTTHLPALIKVLKGYVGQEETARIEVSRDLVSFSCAGSKRALPRLKT